jgi:uncharacterized protein
MANSELSSPKRKYWSRLVRLFIVVLVLALSLVPLLSGAIFMWRLTHPTCGYGSNPGDFGYEYEDVRFPNKRNLTLDGYFIPGTNDATVIVVPTYGNGRGGDLHYADVFHRAGFNVLTFNSPVCAGASHHTLGYEEADDVQSAYDYLVTRADVNSDRVSLHGFSAGGSASLMAAAKIPAIRAVSAEGGYHDYATEMGLGLTNNWFDTLFTWGIAGSYMLVTGHSVYDLSPLNVIDQIAPRPILLIYGSREVTLPGARKMLERAGSNAELWVVEGAGHGQYLQVAREEFERRVVEFHRNALLE